MTNTSTSLSLLKAAIKHAKALYGKDFKNSEAARRCINSFIAGYAWHKYEKSN